MPKSFNPFRNLRQRKLERQEEEKQERHEQEKAHKEVQDMRDFKREEQKLKDLLHNAGYNSGWEPKALDEVMEEIVTGKIQFSKINMTEIVETILRYPHGHGESLRSALVRSFEKIDHDKRNDVLELFIRREHPGLVEGVLKKRKEMGLEMRIDLRIEELSASIASGLIESPYSRSVTECIDLFTDSEHQTIAEMLIEKGMANMLLENYKSFSPMNIDKEKLLDLITGKYKYNTKEQMIIKDARRILFPGRTFIDKRFPSADLGGKL